MSDGLVKQHIIAILERKRDRENLIEQRIIEQVAQGKRVVSVGSFYKHAWEIIDCHTNETVAAGDDGPEGFTKLADSEQARDWVWLEPLVEDLDYVITEGLPESLRDALDDWIGTLSVPDEDIAHLIGWSVSDVAAIRKD